MNYLQEFSFHNGSFLFSRIKHNRDIHLWLWDKKKSMLTE